MMFNAIVIVALLCFVQHGHSWDENKFNCDDNSPCTQEFRDQGQYYFAYDADNTKFVQCDETGGCNVMQCANETVWSTNIYSCVYADSNDEADDVVVDPSKYNCNSNIPCTQAFRDLGQYFFAYDASDSKFVQCDDYGRCYVMPCAPETVWNSEAYTCTRA